ncbi:glycosyltransferase [Weeksellaceae bacterium A-14]
MHKISVIILSYNHKPLIAKAIQGVFMQNVHCNIELIISDDGSTDGTQQAIEAILKETPEHFSVVYTPHPKNLGATPNFFDALSKVTGDYLCFCEGDDYWTDPNKLQYQLDFLESHPEYNMCFHQVTNISPDPGTDGTLFSKVENRDYSMLEIYQHWRVHTTSVFMRSSVLKNTAVKELLKHPELLYFDTFLYMACGTDGKIRGSDRTMSCYLRHEAGISNGINHRRDLRHNHLDQVIGDTYGGKIKESANWQIFSRSRIAFVDSMKQGHLLLAWKHLQWMIRRKGNLKVYLQKKFLAS